MEIEIVVTGLRRRKAWRAAGSAVLVSAVLGVSAAPAHADDHGHSRNHGKSEVRVTQTNLVANRDGFGAPVVDPDLLNAWGMSKFPTSPVWVSNNHSDTSTLYLGGSADAPSGVAKIPLTVSMAGSPTGQVANTAAGFNLANGSAALFIFATEQGQIFSWNQSAGTVAEQTALVPDANFKGLAQGTVDTSAFLYAADFSNGQIVVFDNAWNPVDWSGAFHVRHLPKGLSPFNVQVLTDPAGTQHVFVAYAKLDPATGDEVTGKGLGLVAEFTTDGTFVRRFDRSSMNAPWGLAYAPASWGKAAGDLLVGQFGNGRIEIFNPRNGNHVGTVRDEHHHKLAIDGLWALMAGDETSGGADSILFTAGPNEEVDGLYGVLTFVERTRHERH
jgi:uncharacterized protein (TIGR03118 family)